MTPLTWGPWWLDRERHVLSINEPPWDYPIDLDTCTDSAQVLDWICQVAKKAAGSDRRAEIIAGLVYALNDLLDPQANLCSFGKPSSIKPKQIGELIDRHYP